ncbi:MAG: hypothetical protein IJ861_00285 [Clostridia bacterium]|nr:hypothetical protein [Clostridia bacterium]
MEERVKEQMIRVVADLLRLGTVSKSDIAKITGLSLEMIDQIQNELKSVPV